ncbi:MAG: thiamine pyrophosphate-dependent enzyme, partial [Candidatus Rokuibacteriota bacterium]
IAARAAGDGIPGASVDGHDVLAGHAAVARAAARARAGEGPSLIEAHTIRWVGHFEGDPQLYRAKDEAAEGRRTDPIDRLERHLSERGLLDAVAHAEASPLPEPQDALTDLFAYWPWRD